jgi:hypothetical protein
MKKMTIFENIKSKNIDELAEWLNKYGLQDYSPWDNWFDNNYCNNCESIIQQDTKHCLTFECAWCELNGNKCKYFPDMNGIPWGKQIIKLWLESEDNNGV